MQLLLLKCRCGVEGFFCVTRNNKEYDFLMKWFFSDPDISTHLINAIDGWEPIPICIELETFGLSMCEFAQVVIIPSR